MVKATGSLLTIDNPVIDAYAQYLEDGETDYQAVLIKKTRMPKELIFTTFRNRNHRRPKRRFRF